MDTTRRLEPFRLAVLTTLMTATVPFAPRLTAAAPPAVSEDVPVPGGVTALARAVGIAPVPDRARFVSEVARLIHGEPKQKRELADSRFRRLTAHLTIVGREDGVRTEEAADLVPMPLPAVVWSRAVFQRAVTPAGVFVAVMSDPAAALLAHGLAALDEETLQFFVDHPAMVTRIYEHDAAVFAGFTEHLHIHNNRIVPPGGDRAVPLWEALLGEDAAQPDRFVRVLFAKDAGRTAYLYDVIGHLDSSRAAFALGLWMPDASVRADRFRALASAATSAFGEWHIKTFPFMRPIHDLVSMFSRVQATATGAPAFPASRLVWAHAFASADLPEDPAGELRKLEGDALIDAAWLAEATVSSDLHLRAERLDQFAFGQRAFASADATALPDVLVALRSFPRFRMLMLTLDRIRVGPPSVYAALARQAQRLSSLDASRGRTALAQFQGAIALVARLARVRTIDPATTETLLRTLGAVPFGQDGRYGGALAQWVQEQLHPALTVGNDLDGVLVEALAGARHSIPERLVMWEGSQYRFDSVTAEARRLRRVRERQGGSSIDVALQNLEKIRTSTDARAAAQVSQALFERVDVVLGEALLSLDYAVALGEGRPEFSGTVARRHDFGFGVTDTERRVRTAWALPRQVFNTGVGWHVEGAALGLDIAFAPFALRRISAEALPRAPLISSIERDALTTSLALMNPLELRDEDRDLIAVAAALGRQRVEALAENGGDWQALAREIAMDGRRVRALQWTIGHDPQRIGSLFSMTELLYLGGGGDADLHPWGMAALNTLGCLCTQLVRPGLWTALVGRPQLGLLATTMADLNLRVAVMLHDMELPAALAKSVLAIAVQEFIDQVQPSDTDDWLTLVRTAQAVSRERIEDYIAAATADGPLVPATGTKTARVP